MGKPVDDGGPAFPVPSYVNASGETHDAKHQGLSLRDYFAAKAMQAMISTYTDMVRFEETPDQAEKRLTTFYREMAIDHNLKTSHDDGCEEIAADAYRIADALLAARK